MKRLLLLMVLCSAYLISYGQDRQVSGKLTDDKGETVPGVNVVLKGTTTGTISDIDGNYKVSVPTDGGILVFSFIGMETQEIEIGVRSVIDLIMEADATELSEVVVTALNLKRDTRALGYSITSVSSEDLVRSKDRSVMNSLKGKVAGVQIQSVSGLPGSSTSVVLRGIASFTGNNEALIVVDGIPINNGQTGQLDGLSTVDTGNGVNALNPENIESVSFLKGLSAAVLYGSAASAGAVIITTKDGKGIGSSQKGLEATFTSSYTMEAPLMLPKVQTRFGLGQFGDNLAFINDQETWGDPYDGSLRPWSLIVDNQQLWKRYSSTPGTLREFFDVGYQANNTISLAGGEDNTSFFTSYSYLDQKGAVPFTGQKRHNLKFSGSAKLQNKFRIGGSVEYVDTETNSPQQGIGGDPFYGQLLRISADIPTKEIRNYNDPYYDAASFFTPFNDNPYKILGDRKNIRDENRVFGNANVGFDAYDWLSISYRVGGDFVNSTFSEYRPIEIIGPPNSTSRPGFLRETRSFVQSFNQDVIVSFNKSLSDDVLIDAIVGQNVRTRKSDFTRSTLNALAIPGFVSMNNQIGTPTVSSGGSIDRVIGVYSRVSIAFKDIYFFELQARNDWSSTHTKGNNSFFYPSVSANVVFSELIDIPALSFGKFRASYAQAGNDAAPFRTSSNFFADAGFPLNGLAGVRESNIIGNPNLRPEITKGYELGLESKLFDNRVGIDLTYYNQLSEDQIFLVNVSSTTGYTTSAQNAGSIRNSGIELVLNATPVKSGNFSWNTSLNFTKNKSLVESVAEGIGGQFLLNGFSSGSYSVNTIAKEGEEFGLWSYVGYQKDPDGNLIVDPTTGRPQSDNSGTVVDGRSINPDFNFGFVNTISYKNIQLKFTFDGQSGGYFFSGTKNWLELPGKTHATTYNDRQPFIEPNSVLENTDGTFSPNTSVFVTDANQYWNNRSYEDYIIDASYIKLRELAVSYTLPSSLMNKIPFGSASVALTGRNIFIITSKDNKYSDPESSASLGLGSARGFDYGAIPTNRSFGASLRLTF